MMLLINNKKAELTLKNVEIELRDISVRLRKIGPFDDVRSIYTKYSLIIIYGAIERAFKDIIIERCSMGAPDQLKNFLIKKFDQNAFSFRFDELCKQLGLFDDNWKNNFKKNIAKRVYRERYKTSLSSIFDTRNEFAHGGDPKVTFCSIKKYFNDCLIVIKIFDSTVYKD